MITIGESLSGAVVVPPRTIIWGSAPGWPEFTRISIPGTFPCNIDIGFPVGEIAISFESTLVIAPVNAALDCLPYPITTTSDKATELLLIVTRILFRPFTGISCFSIPTNENTKIPSAGAVIEYFPSKSVTVPCWEPFTRTETPINGSRVSSKTTPFTVTFFCSMPETSSEAENTGIQKERITSKIPNMRNSLLFNKNAFNINCRLQVNNSNFRFFYFLVSYIIKLFCDKRRSRQSEVWK